MENNQNIRSIKGSVVYIVIIVTILLLIQLGIIGGVIYYLNEMNML